MKVVHVGIVNSSNQFQAWDCPIVIKFHVKVMVLTLLLQELLWRTSDYSSQLNPASQLKHFTVEIPPGWDFSLCSGQGERQGTYSSPLSRPDILLGSSHPVFGSHPWTLQNQGCGRKGLLINLPESFVQSTSLDSHVRGQFISIKIYFLQ